MIIAIASITAILLILVVVLLACSAGKPEPFLDNNNHILAGSISEKVFVTIGGVRQGMFIRGKNIHNPVLLFVHGGPAFPTYFLTEKYPSGLEDNFTVCYWEERGGGLSFSPQVSVGSMTFEQLTSDVIEVSNYLRKRFGKGKIYLMAHSGGTPFAIMAAAQQPQIFYAYIGMAQITNQAKSEKLAYRYMMDQYKAAGNEKAIEKLLKYPVLKSDDALVPFFKSLVRDQSMHELGIGTMRNMRSVLKDVFIPVWTCKAYTIREKFNIWKSKFSFIRKTKLIDELFATDIPALIPKLEIPVYFFSGKYDMTVNHDLSREYHKSLQAPLKGFYSFYESAHSPIFEEPLKLKKIMVEDVLQGKVDMADK
ncbi:MAG: alpha/beta hydrolase [Bacteroidetes bacterium]|nr:alpha/beta hydrolase [Bacteroidota bacterium]